MTTSSEERTRRRSKIKGTGKQQPKENLVERNDFICCILGVCTYLLASVHLTKSNQVGEGKQ